MAWDKTEKIERAKEELLKKFKGGDSDSYIESLERKCIEIKNSPDYPNKDKYINSNKRFIEFYKSNRRCENEMLFKNLKNNNKYAKEYAEFMEDSYEINPYINARFIKDAAEYFKNLSDENLLKIQPEFKRLMNIRIKKKLLKQQLFESIQEQGPIRLMAITKRKIYSFNLPQAMYNLESQIKAYSEAIGWKEYNKSFEDKLLTKVIPLISLNSRVKGLPMKRLGVYALGCGSGIHEYEFVSEIIKQRGINEDFIDLNMVDASSAMVEEAVSNAEHMNLKRRDEGKKRINVEGLQLDLNREICVPLRINWSVNRVFLLLGSTLGNFDFMKQREILNNICGAMFPGNDIVISVKGMHYKDGKPDEEKMKQEYIFGENFIYKPLEILGIERECLGEYKVDYQPNFGVLDLNRNEIVNSFPVIKHTTISGYNEKHKFHRGDIIKVAHSQRFTKDGLNDLVRDFNRFVRERPHTGGILRPLEVLEENGNIVGLYRKEERQEDLKKYG